MLSLFTKYLVQYGTVSIPHIGRFELVNQSPQLDIAEKIVRPPFFMTLFTRGEGPSEHQYAFFASHHSGKDVSGNEISSFGKRLKARIEKEPFQWNGFGTLRIHSGDVSFEPYQINLSTMPTIPAQKVIRQHAQHRVLVGDQEVLSQATETMDKPVSKQRIYITIGWIVFAVASIAVAALLYMGKFQPSASGLKW